MTTNHTDAESDAIVAAGLSGVDQWREQIKLIEEAKASQPQRLAKARDEAEQARDWAMLEEPWDEQWTAIPGYNEHGDVTAMLALPNITAKETFSARLTFDMLDSGDDFDKIEDVQSKYFTVVGGDPAHMSLIAMSALSTITTLVVPQMVDELETRASNYDVRVMLAEARHKAWNARVAELRGAQDNAADYGVNPIDGYDIAANAFDPDEPDR
ncbi:MAG: hypothetical protein QOI06_73 [Nocardioidaceae bacterium]|jgi:hypothetical protein|nr:hypothetical protein [Nocardioidaceae bacterium]